MNKQNKISLLRGAFFKLQASHNRISEAFYRKALEKEFIKIHSKIKSVLFSSSNLEKSLKILFPLLKKLEKSFNINAFKIISKFLSISKRHFRNSFLKQFVPLYKDLSAIPFNEKSFKKILKLSSLQNAQLISSVKDTYFNSIANAVYNTVSSGQSPKSLEISLSSVINLSRKRIKLIARDQSAKLNETLNRVAQKDAGIEYFIWQTARDERVSKGIGGHKHLDGKIYKYSDTSHLPIIDSKGSRGLPGDRVNCRCTAIPVILSNNSIIKQNKGGDYTITKTL
nr:MAG TPA: Minor capsid component [Caudoviricetes sp.]